MENTTDKLRRQPSAPRCSGASWRGLQLGASTFDEVMSVLGNVESTHHCFDGAIYVFCQGTVQSTFLSGRSELFKLRILNHYQGPERLPDTLEDALSLFPDLQKTTSSDLGTLYHSRASHLLLCCHPFSTKQLVVWVELLPIFSAAAGT